MQYAKSNSNPTQDQSPFFSALFHGVTGSVELRALPKKNRLFAHDSNDIARFIKRNLDQNLFFGVVTRDDSGGRKENLVEVPALWIDIDFKDTAQGQADKLIADFPLFPSIIVHSGGGYHVYWLLREAQKADVSIERYLKALAKCFEADRAATDISRVLRIPGTLNRKYDPPRQVDIVGINDQRYSLLDFDEFLLIEDGTIDNTDYQAKATENITRIMQCAFMQHCDKDRATLSEPEWFAMISELAREPGGIDYIHSLSQGYPSYSEKETDRKLKHLLNDSGPITCLKIKEIWGCGKDCGVKTPAALVYEIQSKNELKETPDLRACLIDLSSLLKMDIPERPRFFPWLPQGGLTMVYGPRGIGKTYFSLSLAVSLATGKPFLRWSAPPETGVLLVDGEMLISDLRERLVDLLPHETAKPISLLSGERVFMKIDRDLNLANSEFQTAVIGLLEANPELRVVVVDNISCLFLGLKESDKNDWEKIIPWLLTLRRRGIAVVLVHHSGKSGDQRGTSGREDMLDSVIKLEQVCGAQNEGAQFIVRFTKCRGAYGKETEPFEAVLDFSKAEPWTWKVLEESNFDRMMALARDGIDSITDIANELGISKGMISRLKKQGIRQGLLKDERKIIPNED